MNTHNLDKVDENSIHLVFGYIRMHESNFFENYKSVYYNIPTLVNHLCIFYYYIQECFSKHGSSIILNSRGDIATLNDKYNNSDEYYLGEWQSVYGLIDITNKKYKMCKWYIKILKFNPLVDCIHIGIDSSCKKHLDIGFYGASNKSYNYAYRSNGYVYKMEDSYGTKIGNGFQDGDVLIMEFNLVNKTLGMCVNHRNEGIFFKDIIMNNTTYNLAICLEGNCSVQILEFHTK
eukprot:439546_1